MMVRAVSVSGVSPLLVAVMARTWFFFTFSLVTVKTASMTLSAVSNRTYGATARPFVHSMTVACETLPVIRSKALESVVSVSRDSTASVHSPAPPAPR